VDNHDVTPDDGLSRKRRISRDLAYVVPTIVLLLVLAGFAFVMFTVDALPEDPAPSQESSVPSQGQPVPFDQFLEQFEYLSCEDQYGWRINGAQSDAEYNVWVNQYVACIELEEQP
jgi:hypothetical protein